MGKSIKGNGIRNISKQLGDAVKAVDRNERKSGLQKATRNKIEDLVQQLSSAIDGKKVSGNTKPIELALKSLVDLGDDALASRAKVLLVVSGIEEGEAKPEEASEATTNERAQPAEDFTGQHATPNDIMKAAQNTSYEDLSSDVFIRIEYIKKAKTDEEKERYKKQIMAILLFLTNKFKKSSPAEEDKERLNYILNICEEFRKEINDTGPFLSVIENYKSAITTTTESEAATGSKEAAATQQEKVLSEEDLRKMPALIDDFALIDAIADLTEMNEEDLKEKLQVKDEATLKRLKEAIEAIKTQGSSSQATNKNEEFIQNTAEGIKGALESRNIDGLVKAWLQNRSSKKLDELRKAELDKIEESKKNKKTVDFPIKVVKFIGLARRILARNEQGEERLIERYYGGNKELFNQIKAKIVELGGQAEEGTFIHEYLARGKSPLGSVSKEYKLLAGYTDKEIFGKLTTCHQGLVRILQQALMDVIGDEEKVRQIRKRVVEGRIQRKPRKSPERKPTPKPSSPSKSGTKTATPGQAPEIRVGRSTAGGPKPAPQSARMLSAAPTYVPAPDVAEDSFLKHVFKSVFNGTEVNELKNLGYPIKRRSELEKVVAQVLKKRYGIEIEPKDVLDVIYLNGVVKNKAELEPLKEDIQEAIEEHLKKQGGSSTTTTTAPAATSAPPVAPAAPPAPAPKKKAPSRHEITQEDIDKRAKLLKKRKLGRGTDLREVSIKLLELLDIKPDDIEEDKREDFEDLQSDIRLEIASIDLAELERISDLPLRKRAGEIKPIASYLAASWEAVKLILEEEKLLGTKEAESGDAAIEVEVADIEREVDQKEQLREELKDLEIWKDTNAEAGATAHILLNLDTDDPRVKSALNPQLLEEIKSLNSIENLVIMWLKRKESKRLSSNLEQAEGMANFIGNRVGEMLFKVLHQSAPEIFTGTVFAERDELRPAAPPAPATQATPPPPPKPSTPPSAASSAPPMGTPENTKLLLKAREYVNSVSRSYGSIGRLVGVIDGLRAQAPSLPDLRNQISHEPLAAEVLEELVLGRSPEGAIAEVWTHHRGGIQNESDLKPSIRNMCTEVGNTLATYFLTEFRDVFRHSTFTPGQRNYPAPRPASRPPVPPPLPAPQTSTSPPVASTSPTPDPFQSGPIPISSVAQRRNEADDAYYKGVVPESLRESGINPKQYAALKRISDVFVGYNEDPIQWIIDNFNVNKSSVGLLHYDGNLDLSDDHTHVWGIPEYLRISGNLILPSSFMSSFNQGNTGRTAEIPDGLRVRGNVIISPDIKPELRQKLNELLTSGRINGIEESS